MTALAQVGYAGMVVPDHVPQLDHGADSQAGEAYILGYIRALIQGRDGGRLRFRLIRIRVGHVRGRRHSMSQFANSRTSVESSRTLSPIRELQ